nr:with phospholipase A2 [Coprobacter secundus]
MVVILILLAIICLGVVAAILQKSYNWKIEEKKEQSASIQSLDGCCGAHEICEKESLLAAVSKNIEYYDDEELDRFKGYSSNSYSSGEVQEFADVLYTLRSEEVAGWVRSLQLREIELPDQLKDEIVMIVGERRRS